MQDYYKMVLPRVTHTPSSRYLPNSYDVPRWGWLRWVLKKLGWLKVSEFVDYTETYTTVTISQRRVLDLVNLVLREFTRKPDVLVFGPEIFDALLEQCPNITFQLELPHRVLGCRVLLSPYLKESFCPIFLDDLRK